MSFSGRRQGDRVSLIFFGTAPFVQAPFTEDLEVCRELLDEAQVGMAGPQTAFGDAIGLAITLFEHSSAKEKVLIALTDGNDTSQCCRGREALTCSVAKIFPDCASLADAIE
jgi:Ca-activated chloride channel family protein